MQVSSYYTLRVEYLHNLQVQIAPTGRSEQPARADCEDTKLAVASGHMQCLVKRNKVR